MMDAELHMWNYWSRKYGPVEALRDYYPGLCASDPMLTYAVAQHEAAALAILARMKQLADK